MQIIPAKLENASQAEVTSFCYKLKKSYLVSIYGLIGLVVNWSEEHCSTFGTLFFWIDVLIE